MAEVEKKLEMEAKAVSKMQMVHPKEAANRRRIGITMAVGCVVWICAYGIEAINFGRWCAVLAASLGIYRTGVSNL